MENGNLALAPPNITPLQPVQAPQARETDIAALNRFLLCNPERRLGPNDQPSKSPPRVSVKRGSRARFQEKFVKKPEASGIGLNVQRTLVLRTGSKKRRIITLNLRPEDLVRYPLKNLKKAPRLAASISDEKIVDILNRVVRVHEIEPCEVIDLVDASGELRSYSIDQFESILGEKGSPERNERLSKLEERIRNVLASSEGVSERQSSVTEHFQAGSSSAASNSGETTSFTSSPNMGFADLSPISSFEELLNSIVGYHTLDPGPAVDLIQDDGELRTFTLYQLGLRRSRIGELPKVWSECKKRVAAIKGGGTDSGFPNLSELQKKYSETSYPRRPNSDGGGGGDY